MQDIPESNGFMVFRNVLLSVIFFTSSLFYKMSARHERHEYDTSDVSPAWVQHEHNEWNVNVAHVLYERYQWATSAIQTARVRHEWKDFGNDKSENIFSHSYLSYMAYERLQGKKQFHSKNYLLEMPHFYARTRLKSAQQKLNLVMAKAISKSYTLDCSCIIIITDLFIVDNLR